MSLGQSSKAYVICFKLKLRKLNLSARRIHKKEGGEYYSQNLCINSPKYRIFLIYFPSSNELIDDWVRGSDKGKINIHI